MSEPTVVTPECVMEKLVIGLEHQLSREMVNSRLTFDKLEEFAMDFFRIRLRTEILAQRLDEMKVIVPLNWWQHFKHRWFPKWVLNRWPVVTKTYAMRLYGAYPMLKIPDSGDRHLIGRVFDEDSATEFDRGEPNNPASD